MITTLFTMAALAAPLFADEVQCAVAHDPVNPELEMFVVAGVRYGTCCEDCTPRFKADPMKFIKLAAKESRTIGVSLFDPMSGIPIQGKNAKGGYSDFKGTRFFFASAQSKALFDAEPAKFGVIPEKEALFCSVMGHGVASFEKAGAIADFEGTRYAFCCPDCLAKFRAEPTKYAAKAAKHVTGAKLAIATKEKAN